jgi:hypothetical protein
MIANPIPDIKEKNSMKAPKKIDSGQYPYPRPPVVEGAFGAVPVAETTTLVLGRGGFDTLVDTPEAPTMADSREISSREETRAFVRRSFSFSRYSTLA